MSNRGHAPKCRVPTRSCLCGVSVVLTIISLKASAQTGVGPDAAVSMNSLEKSGDSDEGPTADKEGQRPVGKLLGQHRDYIPDKLSLVTGKGGSDLRTRSVGDVIGNGHCIAQLHSQQFSENLLAFGGCWTGERGSKMNKNDPCLKKLNT